jgi:hypothetical protein
MMKIVKSAAVIVASLAIVAAGTYAWDLQTETISGTTFSANSLDLKIDDNKLGDTKNYVNSFASGIIDNKLKPGYHSEQIVDIWSDGDPSSMVSTRLTLKANKENGVLSPESEAGDSATDNDWSGELAQNIVVRISFDPNNDDSATDDSDWVIVHEKTLADLHNIDMQGLGKITNTNGYARIKYEVSVPNNASNKIMTDSVVTDVVIGLE